VAIEKYLGDILMDHMNGQVIIEQQGREDSLHHEDTGNIRMY
jgi:hypothetical protein